MANFAPVQAAGAFHMNNRFNFFEGTLLAALQRHAAPAAIITPPIRPRTLAYGRPRSAILTATGAAFGSNGSRRNIFVQPVSVSKISQRGRAR